MPTLGYPDVTFDMRRFSPPAPIALRHQQSRVKTYYDIAFGVIRAGTASPVDEVLSEKPYARCQIRGHLVSIDLGLLIEGKLGILSNLKFIAGKRPAEWND